MPSTTVKLADGIRDGDRWITKLTFRPPTAADLTIITEARTPEGFLMLAALLSGERLDVVGTMTIDDLDHVIHRMGDHLVGHHPKPRKERPWAFFTRR